MQTPLSLDCLDSDRCCNCVRTLLACSACEVTTYCAIFFPRLRGVDNPVSKRLKQPTTLVVFLHLLLPLPSSSSPSSPSSSSFLCKAGRSQRLMANSGKAHKNIFGRSPSWFLLFWWLLQTHFASNCISSVQSCG